MSTGGSHRKGFGRGLILNVVDGETPNSVSKKQSAAVVGLPDATVKPAKKTEDVISRLDPSSSSCTRKSIISSRDNNKIGPIPAEEDSVNLSDDDFNIPKCVVQSAYDQKSSMKSDMSALSKEPEKCPKASMMHQNNMENSIAVKHEEVHLPSAISEPKMVDMAEVIVNTTATADKSSNSISCGDENGALHHRIEKKSPVVPPIVEPKKCARWSIIPAGEEDFEDENNQAENIMHHAAAEDHSNINITYNALRYIICNARSSTEKTAEQPRELYLDWEWSSINSELGTSLGDKISELSSDFEKLKDHQHALVEKRIRKLREHFRFVNTLTYPCYLSAENGNNSLNSSLYFSAQQSLQQNDTNTSSNNPQMLEIFARARQWLQESIPFDDEVSTSTRLQTTLRNLITKVKPNDVDVIDLRMLSKLIEKLFSTNGFSFVDESLCFPPDAAVHEDMGFPPEFIEQVTSLMDDFPFGVHYRLFPLEFQAKYGCSLNHENLGYTSIKPMYNDLSQIFTFADSKLFRESMGQVILFPTSIVDNIVELDGLILRLWHWILAQVHKEPQGFAVIEGFTERYAAEVMKFKPSIWGLAKEADGWVAFIQMMLDYADYSEHFKLGSTTVKSRMVNILYLVSNAEFVEEWILDNKKMQKSRGRRRYHVKKSYDQVIVTENEDFSTEDFGQSMIDNNTLLQVELRGLFENKNEVDEASKPWDAIDFMEAGENYFDNYDDEMNDGKRKFANEFDKARMKGDDMVKGETKACLFRDAIAENLDFWLVNALDWEHINAIHNYMNTASEYSDRTLVESEEFLLHPNEIVVGLWVAVSSKLLGKREWYRGRVVDILLKEKFGTSATTKTNDIIMSDEEEDEELVNEKLANQAFKERRRGRKQREEDQGETKNSWLQSDRCYKVHLLDVGHSGLYTIDEMRRLTSEILNMAPVMSFRGRFNFDSEYLKDKWKAVKKRIVLKRMDAVIPASYVTVVFHDYISEIVKTKGGHVEERKVWIVSVLIKDFSKHGIAVPDLLKRVLRVDQGSNSKDFSDVDYLRSFIPVRRKGDVPDIDDGEEIVEENKEIVEDSDLSKD